MVKSTTTRKNQSEPPYTVVRRKLPLMSLQGSECEGRIREAFAEMEGVSRVQLQPEKNQVVVQYDAAQLDVQRVAAVLSGAGCPLANTFRSRLKQAWYGFLDENIRDNAAAPPKPCCNNISRLNAGRHKH